MITCIPNNQLNRKFSVTLRSPVCPSRLQPPPSPPPEAVSHLTFIFIVLFGFGNSLTMHVVTLQEYIAQLCILLTALMRGITAYVFFSDLLAPPQCNRSAAHRRWYVGLYSLGLHCCTHPFLWVDVGDQRSAILSSLLQTSCVCTPAQCAGIPLRCSLRSGSHGFRVGSVLQHVMLNCFPEPVGRHRPVHRMYLFDITSEQNFSRYVCG